MSGGVCVFDQILTVHLERNVPTVLAVRVSSWIKVLAATTSVLQDCMVAHKSQAGLVICCCLWWPTW